jgi:psp operon transcriptional activator
VRPDAPDPPAPPDLLGESEALLKAKDRISQAAKVDRPVLLLGGRGTGKELAAARLHLLSARWRGPYVTLNCAALSPGLIDAELFGHEAGAFTGAGRRRPGRFEAADGGTLFLDEVGHLSLEAQARILRVVEYGRLQVVGSPLERQVDTRIVAATNADLRRMCRSGAFLPDLWDRLSFEVIELPPLSARHGDVGLLARHFGARMARELGWEEPPVLSPGAVAALEARPWPGNVRELKNVIERTVYRLGRPGPGPVEVGPGDLRLEADLWGCGGPGAEPPHGSGPSAEAGPGPTAAPAAAPDPSAPPELPLAPGRFEAWLAGRGLGLIEAALDRSGRHQGRAAELLGLSYHKFRALRRRLAAAAGKTPPDPL